MLRRILIGKCQKKKDLLHWLGFGLYHFRLQVGLSSWSPLRNSSSKATQKFPFCFFSLLLVCSTLGSTLPESLFMRIAQMLCLQEGLLHPWILVKQHTQRIWRKPQGQVRSRMCSGYVLSVQGRKKQRHRRVWICPSPVLCTKFRNKG